MSAVSNATSQLSGTTTTQKWGIADTHAEIDATCDKIGSCLIEFGNLVGGPIAMAGVNRGVDAVKTYAAAKYPDSAPSVNLVLEVAKAPLGGFAKDAGPIVSKTSVKVLLPVPRASAHASANLAEKIAGYC